MRSDSGRQSTSSETDGAELVYVKDNVTIHPTQFASERISGRLKLYKQGPSLFMVLLNGVRVFMICRFDFFIFFLFPYFDVFLFCLYHCGTVWFFLIADMDSLQRAKL